MHKFDILVHFLKFCHKKPCARIRIKEKKCNFVRGCEL